MDLRWRQGDALSELGDFRAQVHIRTVINSGGLQCAFQELDEHARI
jgi:hypothetical protein